jgi:hypothetical protein
MHEEKWAGTTLVLRVGEKFPQPFFLIFQEVLIGLALTRLNVQ